MLLKNTKARLITINGPYENGARTKKYQIKPGENPAVEVPDKLCKSPFVKALIDDGTLVEVTKKQVEQENQKAENSDKKDGAK
jgi:hypothetical protein